MMTLARVRPTTAPRPSIAPMTTKVAELFPRQGDWTESEYFALPETNRYLELSEGRLIMPPHPTNTHQAAVGRLYRWLDEFVQAHNLGIVRLAPLPVRLWTGKVRGPDVFFMAREHSDRIGEQFFGPPDLVMEVTSPGTRRVDRNEKPTEYARAGVAEYWIVDPSAQTVEVFVLREGSYRLLARWGSGQIARSALLDGLEISVAQLFVG
jgi:Uma2 family endonuclease